MRLAAAIEGRLTKLLAADLAAVERAVTAGLREASEGLKADLRGQITGAGLGERLARTWRSEIYPKGGRSIRAAGLVWSKAPGIVGLYEDGAVIRSRHGLFLAIPTPAAGRYGDGGKKITPGSWERRTGLILRLIYRRRGPSLLVADNARLSKRGLASANRGRRGDASFTRLVGRTVVPVFILLPQVRVRKRLDVAGAGRAWESRLPDLILHHWPET
jgi:hypothetical protein